MVRRLGLGKNNHLTYTSLALSPQYEGCLHQNRIIWFSPETDMIIYHTLLVTVLFQHDFLLVRRLDTLSKFSAIFTREIMFISFWGWLGKVKVLCILHNCGVIMLSEIQLFVISQGLPWENTNSVW